MKPTFNKPCGGKDPILVPKEPDTGGLRKPEGPYIPNGPLLPKKVPGGTRLGPGGPQDPGTPLPSWSYPESGKDPHDPHDGGGGDNG